MNSKKCVFVLLSSETRRKSPEIFGGKELLELNDIRSGNGSLVASFAAGKTAMKCDALKAAKVFNQNLNQVDQIFMIQVFDIGQLNRMDCLIAP